MSGPSRTFVLQAVAVAVAIGIVYFAFLRPSDPDELAGIEAPGDDTPEFALPDDRRQGKDSERRLRVDGRIPSRRHTGLPRSISGAGGASDDSPAPPAGDDPADDQYTSTATVLMERVRATAGEIGR